MKTASTDILCPRVDGSNGDKQYMLCIPQPRQERAMQREKMEAAIAIIYDKVFNAGRGDLYPDLVAGPYIQHNPLFPNGTHAIIKLLQQVKNVPCEVKRVAIDGDLAFVHVRYLDWGGRETAGVDIFRFDADGKIVEHWDVLQPVPDTSNNNNTMF